MIEVSLYMLDQTQIDEQYACSVSRVPSSQCTLYASLASTTDATYFDDTASRLHDFLRPLNYHSGSNLRPTSYLHPPSYCPWD